MLDSEVLFILRADFCSNLVFNTFAADLGISPSSTFKDKTQTGNLTYSGKHTCVSLFKSLQDICSARSHGKALADGSADGRDGKTQ